MRTVKAGQDATLLFSECVSCDGYEVIIGGDGNKKSAIRVNTEDDRGAKWVDVSLNFPYIFLQVLDERDHYS